MILASLVGENGKVLSFEPGVCYNLLTYNIEINPNLKDRITSYKIGAYNRNCIKSIVTNDLMDNGGIVDDLFSSENRSKDKVNSYNIDVVNMNDFIFKNYSNEDRSKIKFIKIDTEGLDFLILNNIREFISKYKPTIFIEWWNNEILSDIIFDIARQIDYNIIRSDNFNQAEPEDFYKKSNDLILIPK